MNCDKSPVRRTQRNKIWIPIRKPDEVKGNHLPWARFGPPVCCCDNRSAEWLTSVSEKWAWGISSSPPAAPRAWQGRVWLQCGDGGTQQASVLATVSSTFLTEALLPVYSEVFLKYRNLPSLPLGSLNLNGDAVYNNGCLLSLPFGGS